MKKTLVAAIIALTGASAQAEFLTGNELLQRIDSTDGIERSVGLGYVMGVFDMGLGVLWCDVSTKVTAGQVRDITRSYLHSNPDTRHLTADVLVTRALKETFAACPKKSDS